MQSLMIQEDDPAVETPIFVPLAVQNVSAYESGAYTGEVSVAMLQEWGVEFIIIGHSERREQHHETNENVNAKLKAIVPTLTDDETYIFPVVCFGETKEEFEAGKQQEVIKTMLQESIEGITPDQMKDVVLAYEPV